MQYEALKLNWLSLFRLQKRVRGIGIKSTWNRIYLITSVFISFFDDLKKSIKKPRLTMNDAFYSQQVF